MKVAAFMSVARVAVAALALAGTTLFTQVHAQATAPSPGTGVAAQEVTPRRMVLRDIEPVTRG